jgi:hypothetical protein
MVRISPATPETRTAQATPATTSAAANPIAVFFVRGATAEPYRRELRKLRPLALRLSRRHSARASLSMSAVIRRAIRRDLPEDGRGPVVCDVSEDVFRDSSSRGRAPRP